MRDAGLGSEIPGREVPWDQRVVKDRMRCRVCGYRAQLIEQCPIRSARPFFFKRSRTAIVYHLWCAHTDGTSQCPCGTLMSPKWNTDDSDNLRQILAQALQHFRRMTGSNNPDDWYDHIRIWEFTQKMADL